MKGNWKKFTIIISSVLALMIVCTAVNITFDSLTKKVSSQNNNPDNFVAVDPNGQTPTDNNTQGTVIADNGTTNPNNQQNPTNSTANNGNKGNNGNQGVQQQQPQQQQQQAAKNPASYSKSELINYYNNCLKTTYSQRSFTVAKTEVVDVQIKSLLLNGKQSDFLQNAANSILESNKKKSANNSGTKSFSGGNISDDKRYILPTSLYSNAVRSYNVQKNGSGYVITFTLNAEKCNFNTKPPYNSSCTFPLDINEVDLGNLGQINSADFYYPGTTLQATIDGNGRVVKTYVVMPLSVTNAVGEGVGQTVTAEISGQWLCTNIFSF